MTCNYATNVPVNPAAKSGRLFSLICSLFGKQTCTVQYEEVSIKSCMFWQQYMNTDPHSELHFTLIREHKQSVISVSDHIPISEIIDCLDNISTALNEHIVLSITLLLMSCVCICVCVWLSEFMDNYTFHSNGQPWKAGTGLTYLGRCFIVSALPHASLSLSWVWLWTCGFWSNSFKSCY